MPTDRLPRLPMVVLGLLSIAAFGAWFYGFGVLVEPIRQDTGWSEATLGTAFGGSLLLTGVGATVGGRILDRHGSRTLFAAAAALTTLSGAAASLATDPIVFVVAAIVAGGVIGGAGYYHATQAVIARIAPEQRTKGITAMTLWGAFASPVFLPLMGWMVGGIGWRPTMRIAIGSVVAAFLAAALLLPDVRPEATASSLREAVVIAWRDRVVRAVFLAGLAAGAASSLLLLYQVPAMVGAGLALTTASTLAGARGLVQLAGRVPLPAVIRRIGSRRALRGAYVLTAISALLLTTAGSLPMALLFTAVAGVAIGALAAAEGIYAAEVVDAHTLGTALGLHSLLRGVGASVAPILGGFVVDATGSRTTVLTAAAAAAVLAAVLLPGRPDAPPRRRGRTASASTPPGGAPP